MEPLTWELVEQKFAALKPLVDKTINDSKADIARYPQVNQNGESLAQLLANLNYYVEKLGEYHAKTERLKTWTEKRYDIEKALEKVQLVREKKMAIGLAEAAKYEKVQQYLDIMVNAGALHIRVQNARSSARDTTEAIRSRIGQLRGQQRS